MERITRREFLEKGGKTALGIGLGSMIASSAVMPAAAQDKSVSANEKVLIGCIGTGGMGTSNMRSFLDEPDVEIVAVCDVDSSRCASAAAEVEKRRGKKPREFKDYRQLLEMKEINAVVIATPDHWHALPMINAAEAGKDVYLEKPISHDITEAKSMVAAAKRFKTVVQCGTWQRSVQHFRDVNDFLHAGKLGDIRMCRAWTINGKGPGHATPSGAPKELDWDFWVGPAKWEPYRTNIAHYNFRYYYNYAAGLTGDWGAHMLDTVLQGMRDWHPLEVSSHGGKLACKPDDDRTTPDTQIAVYKFPTWLLQWEIRAGGSGLDGGGGSGAEFIGTNGSLIVDRGGVKYTPKDEKHKEELATGKASDSGNKGGHHRNFLDCMKTRELPRSDIFYSNALCHLANLTYQLGRSVKWDGEKQEVIGDREAHQMLSYSREYRKPWDLPRYDLKSS